MINCRYIFLISDNDTLSSQSQPEGATDDLSSQDKMEVDMSNDISSETVTDPILADAEIDADEHMREKIDL